MHERERNKSKCMIYEKDLRFKILQEVPEVAILIREETLIPTAKRDICNSNVHIRNHLNKDMQWV